MSTEKIPTAKELLTDKTQYGTFGNMYTREMVAQKMIEFAKLHVEAQAKTIHRNMQLPDEDLDFTLRAYPLENIK